jgi:predicted nucleic-acid-binding Zn-ribbon protein
MADSCPKCGSSSYSTHKEKERIDKGIVTFDFFSECPKCGFTP